jgi:ectoine hydroxylase-related dioxygenase (phytanoyl-CoA dioxygenase family)
MNDGIFFSENGYVVLNKILEGSQLDAIRSVYDLFLDKKIEVGSARSDLSGLSNPGEQVEKITQIMRPSLFYPELAAFEVYVKALQLAKSLLGTDMALDFDMFINKYPHTCALTPWHQDEAYWLDMADKRATSCWIALDDVYRENGCMWFVPGSHKTEIRKHIQIGQGGALQCKADEAEAIAIPLKAGDATFHHGRTIHYSRGNETSSHRRALILNFRPEKMILFERSQGFDHLGTRTVRNKKAAFTGSSPK